METPLPLHYGDRTVRSNVAVWGIDACTAGSLYFLRQLETFLRVRIPSTLAERLIQKMDGTCSYALLGVLPMSWRNLLGIACAQSGLPEIYLTLCSISQVTQWVVGIGNASHQVSGEIPKQLHANQSGALRNIILLMESASNSRVSYENNDNVTRDVYL